MALLCAVRAVSLFRESGRRELGVLAPGLLLILAGRALGTYAHGTGSEALSLAAAAPGLAGLYLVIVSMVSGRRKDEYTPFNGTVLGCGVVCGIALGGAGLILSGPVAGPAALTTAHIFMASVPVGLVTGMFIEKGKNARGVSLPGSSSVALIAAATMVPALAWTRFAVSGDFAVQLMALLDVTGLTVLLSWLLLEPSGRRLAAGMEMGGCEDAGPDAEVPVAGEKVPEIGRMVVTGARENDIYKAIAAAVASETGAGFVVVRASEEGDERLEVKGYAGSDGAAEPPGFGMSLTGERLGRHCPAESGDETFFIDTASLGDDREAFVPAIHASEKGSIAVMPVREEGAARAVIVAGFFRSEVPAIVGRSMAAYQVNAMQVIGRETWAGRTRRREKELVLCREELESVNQMKSNFLSIVSHELRTPLTSIKAYTETLMDNIGSIETDTANDFLKVMGEENDRVISLVDNILNYSCMESGHLKVEKVECDLRAIIEEVHAGLESRFLTARVNSELKLPKGKVILDADGELIMQMLHNLMTNALKFTPEGGMVTVTLEEEASAARIVVQDTGRGIPEDQLEKIFERFHQVDASDTREHGGSGLGLAICKNIVEWHDGNIWVENVKEAGAKFTVMLPMKDIIVRHAAASGFIGSVRFERERFLTLLVEMLSGFLQARKASIMIFDPRDRTLQVVAAKGLDPEFVQNTRVEVGERISGKVFEQEEAMYAFDIERESGVSRSNNTAYYFTKSFISVPLRRGDDVIGVLNVADHVEGRGFTGADREILESLGPVISGMVKKLDAYETVSSNFEKLKEAMKSILHIREVWGARNMLNFTMIAMSVGRRLNLDEKSMTALRMGMSMYDLGMMKIPRSLRIKKETLTEKEWDKLREHPDLGYTLVAPMGLDERIMKMVRCHHEHYDGSGYPAGLMKDEIPVETRIINVVDSFRALITPGPYRRCYSIDEAKNEIIRGSGTRFDPKIVGAFVKALLDLGAREEGCELVLDAFEREIEEKALESAAAEDAVEAPETTDGKGSDEEHETVAAATVKEES
jgi:signal transduction histidine kinase/HD-GYP domain-containing protein (c-di-GMP phosphodiesterase class II)